MIASMLGVLTIVIALCVLAAEFCMGSKNDACTANSSCRRAAA